MKRTFEAFWNEARAAEAAGDLDGCASAQLAMYALTQQDRSLLRQVDTTYLRVDVFIRVVAAALLAQERGDVELAERYFAAFPQSLLSRPGYFPEFRATRGQLAYARGAMEEAETWLSAHLDAYPQDETAWLLLGNAAARQGKLLQAVHAYDEALHQKAHLVEAAENRQVVIERLMAPAGAPLPVLRLREPDGALGIDPTDWEVVRRLPIFINCRDRVDCLQRLVRWLLAAGYRQIILLDNASTYAPLLAYYDRIQSRRVRVVRLGENLGHQALWTSGILEWLDVRTPYVYTDPDVLPGEACPPRFLRAFAQQLALHPAIRKVGAALVYEDITYRDAEAIKDEEASYYHAPLGGDAYFATVDTTFALYRNVRFYHRGPSIRMAGTYAFRHLPWYYDYAHLPEDEQYYLAHANASSSIGNVMAKGKV